MTKTETELKGVRAKLAARKDETGKKFQDVTLPVSGISAQIPAFLNHKAWMVAQRQAKGDTARAQAALVAATVKFEGEKFTLADIIELFDARDILFIVGEIFGDDDDDDEDELGNVKYDA